MRTYEKINIDGEDIATLATLSQCGEDINNIPSKLKTAVIDYLQNYQFNKDLK